MASSSSSSSLTKQRPPPPPPPTITTDNDGDEINNTNNDNDNHTNNEKGGANQNHYYERGSLELTVETPVMRRRLETRRTLTGGSNGGSGPGITSMNTINSNGTMNGNGNPAAERLLIVLVGLPARGKSFIARKLLNYLTWRGNQCRIFNVGKYRRKLADTEDDDDDNDDNDTDHTTSTTNGNNSKNNADTPTKKKQQPQKQNADFFNDSNQTAAKLRQEAAQLALDATLDWLDDGDNITTTTTTGSTTTTDPPRPTSTQTQPPQQQQQQQQQQQRLSYSARRQFHRIAIYDATNSTNERRQWILQECAKHDKLIQRKTGVLFLESICDDKELLEENLRVKIASCPDFKGMTQEEALADLRARIDNYEARYETIIESNNNHHNHDNGQQQQQQQHHQSYIKIFNLSSRLMVNHIYGRLAKVVLPAIMAWNTGSRPIYLCRAGETAAMETYMKKLRQEKMQQQHQNQKSSNNNNNSKKIIDKDKRRPSSIVAHNNNRLFLRRKKSDRLGERGFQFRDALCDFIEKEGLEFYNNSNSTNNSTNNKNKSDAAQPTTTAVANNNSNNNNNNHPNRMHTGTSIAGLYEEEDHPFEDETCFAANRGSANSSFVGDDDDDDEENENEDANNINNNNHYLPFPCLVMSSAMPRAVETASWEKIPFPVKDVTNLNPLDMGDFTGMDLASIREQYPEWYEELKREPLYTRFPGGESYGDLIDRLGSIIIDMEQQLGLAVAVGHVSVLQVLVSYFRASSPIHKCMDIEIPMHTVFKFVPLRGGGWLESQHKLLSPDDDLEDDILETITNEGDDGGSAALDSSTGAGAGPIWGDSRSCLPRKLSQEQLVTEL